MSIGSAIMNKRKVLGYTQQELADRLKVSFQAVSKWETGSACPDITMLPKLASVLGTSVDALLEYRAQKRSEYDIIFSSGVFHYIRPQIRGELIDNLKAHTCPKGIHAINVFAEKPFITPATDLEEKERKETVFDCNSGGIPHQHCMDIMFAEKTI